MYARCLFQFLLLIVIADPEVSSAQPDNNVSGNSGYITSPNYPEDYPTNEDYEVTVTLDQAGPQTVELTLDDFDVESCPHCVCDIVLINGDGSNRLCGVKNGQKISVDVAGDTFTVTLHTDSLEERRGFNISYKVEQGKWLEKSCDSDGDCPDGINATCFEGKCLCTPGYYYSNGQDVCVDSCPVADQQGEFLLYPNSGIMGYNIALQSTADTLEECLDVCAADPNCLTVNVNDEDNVCGPNLITPLQDQDVFISGFSPGIVDLYQKRCA